VAKHAFNYFRERNPEYHGVIVGGKDGVFGFFVGLVMKETQGLANPVITSDLLHKRLGR
jgi:aspartyl-tRNA(Asn)/glutamyl-tRNA(Gln) amidotransferase subunit B